MGVNGKRRHVRLVFMRHAQPRSYQLFSRSLQFQFKTRAFNETAASIVSHMAAISNGKRRHNIMTAKRQLKDDNLPAADGVVIHTLAFSACIILPVVLSSFSIAIPSLNDRKMAKVGWQRSQFQLELSHWSAVDKRLRNLSKVKIWFFFLLDYRSPQTISAHQKSGWQKSKFKVFLQLLIEWLQELNTKFTSSCLKSY